MKSFKTTLTTSLGLLFLGATIMGGSLDLDELTLLLLAIIITGFFRVYYREIYKYLTEYESLESSNHHPDELKKSAAESSKSKLA